MAHEILAMYYSYYIIVGEIVRDVLQVLLSMKFIVKYIKIIIMYVTLFINYHIICTLKINIIKFII